MVRGLSIGAGSNGPRKGGKWQSPAQITVAGTDVTEGGDLVFTVSLDRKEKEPVTVDYEIVFGTASVADLGASTALIGQITVPAGDTSAQLTVSTFDDTLIEEQETLQLVLSNPSENATIADGSASVVVLDNDAEPVLSLADTAAAEGESLDFVVSLDKPSPTDVTADWEIVVGSGSGAAELTDFAGATSGTVGIPAGNNSATISVPVASDSLLEGDETFQLQLSNLTGTVQPGDLLAAGTIRDATQSPVKIEVSDATVSEGGDLVFTLSLDRADDQPVTVDYEIVFETASAADLAVDAPITGQVTVPAGGTSEQVSISTLNDTLIEGDETLQVVLSNPSANATIINGFGAGTILDEDTVPLLSIADAAADEGQSLDFVVSLDKPSSTDVTAAWQVVLTSGPDAAALTDLLGATSGTVTITAGDTSATISVPAASDQVLEQDETFQLQLSNLTGTVQPGALIAVGTIREKVIDTRMTLDGNRLKIRLDQIHAESLDALSLGVLDVDGQSVLGDVTGQEDRELATTTEPGRISGSGQIVSGLAEPLEVGALYLVSYEILADNGTTALFFSDGGGCPFPNSVDTPFTVGHHKILVEAKDTDTKALMRVTGDLTFGRVSCRRAEWSYTLPSGTAYPERAETTEPGQVQGSDVVVSAFDAPLEPGVSHTLRYEILRAQTGSSLYVETGAGSPAGRTALPTTPGHHSVTITAETGSSAAAVFASGDLSIGHISCRRAGSSAGRQIVSKVLAGSSGSESVIYTPDPGLLYVAPWSKDTAISGASFSPFKTPAQALEVAGPGDTIILRPGIYAPFEVTASGAVDRPLVITTLPTEARQAVIEGDLMQHVVYGGPGVEKDTATRDGIYIQARDHVQIRNLTIRNVWRAGILVVGTPGEVHGHHVLSGNAISMTGASGIYVGGQMANTIIPLSDINSVRTDDVTIEFNDVSKTNVVTDFNSDMTNSKGEPGGVTEAISVAALAGNIVTRFNDVHDTRQYGIDYKAGVRGGAIHGNRIWNVDRYGIYLDSGRRFVEDIAIYGNQVWACKLGIVLSREAGSNTIDYDTFRAQEGPEEFVQTLKGIDIYNNVVWDILQAGIYLHRHNQKDGPDGEIRDIRVRFNTVHNANRSGSGRDLNLSGWADADFLAAGIVSGVEFIGNIVSNDTDAVSVLDEFSGQPGFTVTDNLIGSDPKYSDPAADPPDLALTSGSPAIGLVDASATSAPFDRDFEGTDRTVSRAAGAYA